MHRHTDDLREVAGPKPAREGRGHWKRFVGACSGVVARIAGTDPDSGPMWPGGNTRAPAQAQAQARVRVRASPYIAPLAWATIICGLATVAASALLRVFDLSNVVMLFLLTVVFVALRFGRAAGAWAAFVCVGCFDFFFVEPRWSFAVSDTQYVFTFALMLAVALAIGQLAARLRTEARAARANEKRSAAHARVAHDLSAAIETEQIASVCTDAIGPLLGVHVALVLPDADDRV
ncbi:DUF4118 domain-containing protein, partial [Burkholderia sp. Ac-20353]|uniref:DUF4118 domain-containing protein n=1 Tax=Burkholderia sp. Ac-20353 TaxID=2703894 RepID=UPI003217C8F9